jgi:hypothetical protein
MIFFKLKSNRLNSAFVLGEFTRAYNYEDLLEPALTEEEQQIVKDNSTISACYKLLKNRCIDGIEIDKRPIHLVDVSRKKYLIRTKGNWERDQGGHKFIKGITDKIKDLLTTNPDKDSPEVIMENNQKLIDLHQNSQQILNYVNEHIILKNNALPVKNILM